MDRNYNSIVCECLCVVCGCVKDTDAYVHGIMHCTSIQTNAISVAISPYPNSSIQALAIHC